MIARSSGPTNNVKFRGRADQYLLTECRTRVTLNHNAQYSTFSDTQYGASCHPLVRIIKHRPRSSLSTILILKQLVLVSVSYAGHWVFSRSCQAELGRHSGSAEIEIMEWKKGLMIVVSSIQPTSWIEAQCKPVHESPEPWRTPSEHAKASNLTE